MTTASILLIIWLALFWFGPGLAINWHYMTAPYTGEWYAVYLLNGQVLYGQIRGFTKDTLRLVNVYYIQTLTVGERTTNNIVRRGTNEVSAPENWLLINRDQILYWEKIGKDAPVMKVIRE